MLGPRGFSTSTMVSGRLYGASHLAPTPAWLGAAVLDMEAAYTEASGCPSPDFVEPYAGSIPTNTVLAPGIYKWTSVVTAPVDGVITFDWQGQRGCRLDHANCRKPRYPQWRDSLAG